MANKMLIDASHPEETRVVVLRGNRIEEFDFESASKKPLRGNIYLAKVTRVEPSLQAAFIEYGGNRHGFLAFSEIHPDYYQIPVADRQALLEEELRNHKDEEEEEPRGGQRRNRRSRRRNGRSEKRARNTDETVTSEPIADAQEGSGEQQNSAPEQHDDHAASSADVPANSDIAPPADQPAPALGEAAHEWTPRADVAPAPESAEQATAQADAAQESRDPESAAEATASADQEHAAHDGAPEAPAPASDSQPAETAPANEPVASADDDAASAGTQPDRAERDEPVAHDEPGHHVDRHDHDDHDEDDDDEDDQDDDDDSDEEEEEHVEHVGGDDFEEIPTRSGRSRRQYKIQEVIRRRQVLLVQVVKEERGNKGAALTTYLSLAGRYSVLMPNTARGGGISRKITDNEDRKRLKEIAQDLEVPEGMGVILRTAGASRTKQEVRRDFEYLLRMWESVRELTLESTAPTLVYEEGSLIKRSIRDLYGKEIDEVTVAGEDGFREARDYMRMLMPSHAKNVKPWRETQPLFARMGVEAQLDAMFSSQVTLKSGGYIVINQTEALVAIDVNSGRSTREHNIEDTALRTNLEAADEVARQLRLRDLAGLIVVDFIDMEENRNNRAVERRLKEALKNDRARIQVGRISHFGLLEMSRQRMRTGVLEGSSVVCPHCNGAGTVRSTASIALHILRVIEDTLIRNAQYNLTVRTRTNVALYILNQKRAHLAEIEARFGVTLTIEADDTLTGTVYHAVERGDLASAPPAAPKQGLVRLDSIAPLPEVQDEDEPEEAENDNEDEDEDAEAENGGAAAEGQNGENGRKRRRRRRRRGRDRDSSGIDPDAPQPSDEALAAMAQLGGDLPSGEVSGHDIPALDLPRASDAEVDEAEAEKEGEDALAAGQGEGRRRRRPRRPRRDRGDHASEPGFRSPYGTWVRSEEDAAPDFGAQPEVVDLSQPEFQPPTSNDNGEERQPLTATEPAQPEAESGRAATPVSAVADEQPRHDEQPAPVAAQPEPQAASPAETPAPEAPAAEAHTEAQPEAEKTAQPAPREPEPLPEAPPPAEKRRGWWQRAKAQITGE